MTRLIRPKPEPKPTWTTRFAMSSGEGQDFTPTSPTIIKIEVFVWSESLFSSPPMNEEESVDNPTNILLCYPPFPFPYLVKDLKAPQKLEKKPLSLSKALLLYTLQLYHGMYIVLIYYCKWSSQLGLPYRRQSDSVA